MTRRTLILALIAAIYFYPALATETLATLVSGLKIGKHPDQGISPHIV